MVVRKKRRQYTVVGGGCGGVTLLRHLYREKTKKTPQRAAPTVCAVHNPDEEAEGKHSALSLFRCSLLICLCCRDKDPFRNILNVQKWGR